MRNTPYVRVGVSKEALVDRIKARIASLLVMTVVGSIFVGALPARADDSCYPYPEQVCNTENWFRDCVFAIVWYGQPADYCNN